MFRKYRKHLALLFAGSFSMVLAACYGMPVDMQNDVTIKTVNEQNEAIPGLKIVMSNNGEHVFDDVTNDLGYVYYPGLTEDSQNDYQFLVEDIDGDQNSGSYLKQVIDVIDNKSEYIITMQKQ
jgi:hypothetical protein